MQLPTVLALEVAPVRTHRGHHPHFSHYRLSCVVFLMTTLTKLAEEIKDKALKAPCAARFYVEGNLNIMSQVCGYELGAHLSFDASELHLAKITEELYESCTPARISALMDVVLRYEKALRDLVPHLSLFGECSEEKDTRPFFEQVKQGFDDIRARDKAIKYTRDSLRYAEERLKSL
jgi:hypothetical protein